MGEREHRLHRSNVRWVIRILVRMGFLIFHRWMRWGKKRTFLSRRPSAKKKVRNFPFIGAQLSDMILLRCFARTSQKLQKKEINNMTEENVTPEEVEVEVEVEDAEEAAVVEDAEIDVEADDAE
jgi:hypothetical protein